MNRRALAIALLVAIMGVVLVAVYLRRFEVEASGGAPVTVLVLLKPIEPGEQITEEVLATRDIPLAYVQDRAVLAKDKPKVLGLRMGLAIETQQTLMWTDLAIAMEERRNLSSLIQPGMRAVTIGASNKRADKAHALIRPGDRLDVVATVATDQKKAQNKDTSVVLLQNVLVLAVGTDTGSDFTDVKGEGKNLLLTLSVTVPESQLLALAGERGKLSVALRNPDDVRIIDSISDIHASALSDTVQRSVVQGVRKTGSAPEKF
jgi:pilus assembly protein CpaB